MSKFDLGGGNLFHYQFTRGIKVGFGAQPQRGAGVLRKGLIAPGRCLHPDEIARVQKIQQHLFVISAQTNNVFGIFAAQIQHVLDTARNVPAAINQVTEKDQLVGRLVARQHFEQAVKLRAASVDVADDESFHAHFPLPLGEGKVS